MRFQQNHWIFCSSFLRLLTLVWLMELHKMYLCSIDFISFSIFLMFVTRQPVWNLNPFNFNCRCSSFEKMHMKRRIDLVILDQYWIWTQTTFISLIRNEKSNKIFDQAYFPRRSGKTFHLKLSTPSPDLLTTFHYCTHNLPWYHHTTIDQGQWYQGV